MTRHTLMCWAGITFCLLAACTARHSEDVAESPQAGSSAIDGNNSSGTNPVVVDGFLSNRWRDVAVVFGVIGTIATLVGLFVGWVALRYTILQIEQSTAAAERSATVSEAATRAAIEALDESREHYNRHVISNVHGFLQQSIFFVKNEDWELAALRLNDLADLLLQIADADGAWIDFATRLRSMEESFSRVGKNEIKFSPSHKRNWLELRTALSEKIAANYGPFPAAEKGFTV